MIVDDHDLFRYGLVAMFRTQPDLEVVAEAGSVEEAVKAARKHQPDLILLDLGLPDGSGLSALHRILAQFPETKVCVLTVHDDHHVLLSALRLGAKGYLLKNLTMNQLLTAIRVMERGEVAIPRVMVGFLLDDYTRIGSVESSSLPARSLTTREFDVLELLGKGASNRQIADRLVIALNTVKVHLRNIREKLNLPTRGETAKFARRYTLHALPVRDLPLDGDHRKLE
jgi:DNA-binding NarL/FixJ family response regulator